MGYDIDSMYQQLKEDIVSLDLLPGTKIKEEDLAFRFNVSRTPIRSVIARLEKDGLLEVVSQRGTYVSKIDNNNLREHLFLREAVEESIIKIVANVLTENDLSYLEKILEEQKEISIMDPCLEKSKKFYDNDNEFHSALYKIAGHENVWNVIYQSTTPLNRVRMIANLRGVEDIQKVYEDHYSVYKNLKEHNAEKAIEAMKKHLDEGFVGIENIIEKYSNYFKGDE